MAGLISHSHRMVRRAKFDESLEDLIASVLAERVELSRSFKDTKFINAHELVSLKLLAISLAKEQAVFWKKPNQARFAIQSLEIVGQLLLTATQKPKLSHLKLREKRKQPKQIEDIVSPLNLVTNKDKRAGVLGNYVQILQSVCALRKDFSEGRLYLPYNEEEFMLRRKLIEELQQASNDYLDLKGRDLCDVVKTVVNVRLMTMYSPQLSSSFTEKQLRVLAKRTALALG